MRVKRMLGLALAVAALAVGLLGCASEPTPPVPTAEITDQADGATTPLPVALQTRTFPLQAEPTDNPMTPARIELGRQLFFEPALSTSQAMACATCHQPQQGLSNGQQTSTPRPGAPGRNVPTLWNVGFRRFLTWDGREIALESQARGPLTLPHEMAAVPAELEAKLRAIPAYVTLFDQAFGGGVESVTFDNVTRALAAFERTLVSDNSAVDRFLNGDQAALSAAQRRGLDLFFSERTHCAECHQPPTFAMETFRVVGVEAEDLGRAGVSELGVRGAFRVPTLRNIARSGPYMHNGSLPTLETVVEFYAAGGGRVRGVPYVDPLIKGFELSAQEQADLIAFLEALTDESRLPAVPARALSGLPTGLAP